MKTIYLVDAMVAIIFLYAGYRFYLYKKAKRLEMVRLKAVLETLRILVWKGQTSKNFKGIIPKKVWAEAQKVVALTAMIEVNLKGQKKSAGKGK